MSNPTPPIPVSVVPDSRPREVVIISHSPLFYWWPVWAIGFLMAALSYFQGYQMAFVPRDTVAERNVQIAGQEGPRDVLIVPKGQSLPSESDNDELKQPRLRVAASNNLGILWMTTLCIVVVVTHLQLRGVWSLVALMFMGSVIVLLSFLGLWDPIVRSIQVLDIHINAFGYLSISLFLFVIWLIAFFFVDRMKYMIFTRGRLRVRKLIGEGEKVYDTRGMVFQRHRDDLFRHWLLGFGSGDLTVRTSGTNPRQIEMLNVLGVGHKLTLINSMVQERAVVQVPR
jgi:hypothetical protein